LIGCVSRDTALPLEANAREERRSALLGKHSFHRDRFDPGMLGLLAGNGEMGGLVALDGLGFDSIWCADLGEDRANRVPLEGLRVQLDGPRLESGKIGHGPATFARPAPRGFSALGYLAPASIAFFASSRLACCSNSSR
jgi:hypothetical protein